MIRGMKKKLLIGLLTAAVVGSSLAPSVPYSVEFTQEAQAEESATASKAYKLVAHQLSRDVAEWKWDKEFTADTYYKTNTGTPSAMTSFDSLGAIAEGGTATVYTKNAATYTAVASPEVGGLGSYYERSGSAGSYTYTLTEDQAVDNSKTYYTEDAPTYTAVTLTAVPAAYGNWKNEKGEDVNFETAEYYTDKDVKISGENDTYFTSAGKTATVYTREEDNSKSLANIKANNKTDSSKPVTVSDVSVDGKYADTQSGGFTIDKNVDKTVTFSLGVDAQSIVSKVTATVDGKNVAVTKDGDVFKMTLKATEDVTDIVLNVTTEDLIISPNFVNGLASNVGTLEVLTSTADAAKGEKIQFIVKLKKEEYAEHVKVTMNGDGVPGTQTGRVVTYTIPTGSFTSEDKNVKINIEGQLPNGGLDVNADDGQKSASVVTENTFVDANELLDVVLGDVPNTETSSVKLTATESTAPTSEKLDATVKLAEGYTLAGVIDVTIEKTDASGATEEVNSLKKPISLKYLLPVDARGKKNYVVYKSHVDAKGNETIKTITTSANADGEYFTIEGNYLVLHAKNFSEFAVAYGDEAAPVTPSDDDKPSDVNPSDDQPTPDVKPTDNGAVTPANPAATAGATATTAKADSTQKAAPAAKKLSAKTGSPKTADYAVNSLLALLTGAAGLFGISLMNSKKRKDEDQ